MATEIVPTGTVPKKESCYLAILIRLVYILIVLRDEVSAVAVEVRPGEDPLDRRLGEHVRIPLRGSTGFIRIFALPDGTFAVDNTVANEMNEPTLVGISFESAFLRVIRWIEREEQIRRAERTRLGEIAWGAPL